MKSFINEIFAMELFLKLGMAPIVKSLQDMFFDNIHSIKQPQ